MRAGLIAALLLTLAPLSAQANIIDGTDERGSILAVGTSLGLSPAEIARIRKVSGHVGCFQPEPVVGSGALFLADDQILTAGHIFFEASGARRGKCFFRPQTPGSQWLPLLPDAAHARFGAVPPKPGSNDDWAIVKLAAPLANAAPFAPADVPPKAGDKLIVVTAQPAGFESQDPNVPVAQGCTVRRVPVSQLLDELLPLRLRRDRRVLGRHAPDADRWRALLPRHHHLDRSVARQGAARRALQ